LAVAALLSVSSSGTAQRPKKDATAPAAAGKVVAYDADKSISIEVLQRGMPAKKLDFVIVKDKTKVDLVGVKAIEVGTQVQIWIDKDDAKNATRILAGAAFGPGEKKDIPTAKGKVAAYEAAKSITVEVPARGGLTKKVDFVVSKDKTKVEYRRHQDNRSRHGSAGLGRQGRSGARGPHFRRRAEEDRSARRAARRQAGAESRAEEADRTRQDRAAAHQSAIGAPQSAIHQGGQSDRS
jgi:hypothetical protein